MKRLIPLLLLGVTAMLAEEVTVKQSALLKVDRNVVSVKPGTVVELISRDANTVTIKYRGLTGKIPASKLEEPPPGAPTTAASDAPAPPAAKPSKQKPTAKKPAPKKPAETKPAERKLAENPQTGYGKAVKKAQDNAAAHDRNVVKPTDEVLKER